ncbi:sugar porter family MFS transporter [Acetobacter oeni]|uniref:MFS transporter n=1 Tax=Acetobacter oeni TaxID=304077 RepID=A0A511XK51_9PROT|nr:sugar porter family MFS transporter [Acetobacter oeni]MBB3883145.1 sugar porter (SP) family MFS transporter [Acetobacter oeni]NHO19215.1 sugar porter family MFS transporter [Acetobacter oeni]GBR05171.1 major facilitator superfamily sugar transporter [Acetobacter oeni LMG 21952]GEN63325.1 MFS transporter [Acetobacter oeni]
MNDSFIVGIIAVVAATGGLLFGYDTGIISAALLQITRDFSLSVMGQQIVTSAIIAGALIGCLGSAPVSDHFGRRRTIMIAAAIFLVGTIGATLSGTVPLLTLSRFILGLAVGASSQIVPVYIAEIVPANRRGQLVVLFQMAVVFGITVSFITGYLLRDHSWRLMFGLGAIPAILLLLGMAFLPNSPRWMTMQGDVPGARKVLRLVRSSDRVAERELDSIISALGNQAGWPEIFKSWLRPAVVAAVGVALLTQITGINAVLYYAPTIFASVGFGQGSAILASIPIGVAMILATVFGSWAVDAWGRRALMLRLLPFSALSLAVLAVVFMLGATQGANPWIAVGSLVAYAIFNAGSLSVTIWLIGAEVFPLSVRSKGMSLVAGSHWAADLLVSLFTLSLIGAIGAAGTFWLFAGVNLAAAGFVYKFVPETKGRSLEEIETSLREHRFSEG